MGTITLSADERAAAQQRTLRVLTAALAAAVTIGAFVL